MLITAILYNSVTCFRSMDFGTKGNWGRRLWKSLITISTSKAPVILSLFEVSMTSCIVIGIKARQFINNTKRIIAITSLYRCVFAACTYSKLVVHTLIARFIRPTWGPSGADRTQVGPMLAPWTLLSGYAWSRCGTLQPCKNVIICASDAIDLSQIDLLHVAQIPQCTSSISHNSPFRAEMCTFLFWMVYCGIWEWCIGDLWKLSIHSTFD